jgi:outer membrane protein assembly factor BamB
VIIGDRLIVLCNDATELVGAKSDLTSILWRLPTTSRWSSDRPQAWHEWILAGDEKGQLVAVDPVAGMIVWSHQLSGTIRGIGVDDSTIFVGTYEGTVRALRAK